jgi:hypothetical protein
MSKPDATESPDRIDLARDVARILGPSSSHIMSQMMGEIERLRAALTAAVPEPQRPLIGDITQWRPSISDMPQEDQEQWIGWTSWAHGVRHEDCPYRDQRRAAWQFGWRAAEQNYRKAIQEARSDRKER